MVHVLGSKRKHDGAAVCDVSAGAVELEKLPLKRDALKKLKLPIDIKSGECTL